MTEWKPTIGKWYDEDNYTMVTPVWRRMLNATLEYTESKEVLTVLTPLSCRNITADDIQIYVIGYLLHQKGVDLHSFMPDSMIAKLHSFLSHSGNIYYYTALVLKEQGVSDDVIEELVDNNQPEKHDNGRN